MCDYVSFLLKANIDIGLFNELEMYKFYIKSTQIILKRES